MFHVVLHQPEIPPNCGNIIRLCANAGCRLHLVRPIGFLLRNKELHRAGLDYHDLVAIASHATWRECRTALEGRRLFAVTTQGTRGYTKAAYRAGDAFVFGSETRGLPATVLSGFEADARIRIPMVAESRSLNLANAVALVVYEAWRQLGFTGASRNPREVS
ncbi:MAG: tRNA (cytidine(34)-2'-O)-methyltransferase [Burkholderiales bacterium]|nr:tRNA (cytidine(34)-2'-O)-methyltransferase [Burkholderiales bacterium]